MINDEQLKHLFTYHPPINAQIPAYKLIRDNAYIYARFLSSILPKNDEHDIAIEKIREAVMWANASMACGANDKKPKKI